MNKCQQILSDLTVYMKYAKYIPELKRRETWEELVERNKQMHIKKYPALKDEIDYAYTFVLDKKVLPSMRSMQFAGRPIELSPNRLYNCCFLPIDNIQAFPEIMFLLLGGTGVGYSVQRHHVEALPEIIKPSKKRHNRRFVVEDSITGWADAIKILMKSYFGKSNSTPVFDFSDIRPKGTPLITSGGKAPGPQPLISCINNIKSIMDVKEHGDKLTPLEVHDIVCYIADAVLAGGIRRAALISLFSADDDEMLTCKSGKWYELNPQRGRANNSAVLLRHRVTKAFFMDIWKRTEDSKAGEPGIYLTNDKEWGTNPCCEIGLRPFQFCNLCEINASNIESQEDLNERSRVASFIGTLQAGYTDFHYLREIWKRNTEKDALIGVSMTGLATQKTLEMNFTQAAEVVIEENKRVAELIGINPAARTTAIKPAGTTSLTLGTSSGIHAWFSEYYIRRIRVGKNEAIYKYLVENHPELIEDCVYRPHDTGVVSVPQKAPEGAILRTEDALSLLTRIKKLSLEWVKPGHIKGNNTHNVSATVNLRPNEWEIASEWMWRNREVYNGLSVLPHSDHTYQQTPFEEITKEEYERLEPALHSLDLTKVIENTDQTAVVGELACGADGCEVTIV